MEIPFTAELVEKIKINVILHYYEKLLPLCGGGLLPLISEKHVDCSDAAGILRKSIESGNGILLTIAHFGAVEFLVPSLSTYKVPLNAALRFTTEQFSRMAAQRSRHMEESGLFGPIKFIEIGKPGTAAALEMAAAIRRKRCWFRF